MKRKEAVYGLNLKDHKTPVACKVSVQKQSSWHWRSGSNCKKVPNYWTSSTLTYVDQCETNPEGKPNIFLLLRVNTRVRRKYVFYTTRVKPYKFSSLKPWLRGKPSGRAYNRTMDASFATKISINSWGRKGSPGDSQQRIRPN